MTTRPDCAIIGGGIIGLTTAYFLAREGHTVTVYDQGEPGSQASWAGAGILPPGNPHKAATPIDQLRAISVARFAEFSQELLEQTGQNNGYRVCGGIEFLSQDDTYALTMWEHEGIHFEHLDTQRLQAMAPALVPPELPAYYLPDCAQLRNPWHIRALRAACERGGVRIVPNTAVSHWEIEGEKILGMRLAGGEVVAAGRYLLTAGAWTQRLLAPLGFEPGIRPIRGQILCLRHLPETLPHILMLGKEYMVPRGDGLILIGSTEEPEAGFRVETTSTGQARLREFACRTLPVLAEAQQEASWAGLRPGSADGMPYLGPVPGWDSVLVAAGHGRAGVQLSLGTALVTADLIMGRTPLLDPDPFRLDREPFPQTQSAFRS